MLSMTRGFIKFMPEQEESFLRLLHSYHFSRPLGPDISGEEKMPRSSSPPANWSEETVRSSLLLIIVSSKNNTKQVLIY